MEDSSLTSSFLDDTLRAPTNHSPYLRDVYTEIDSLRKENFQLRLRIHLSEGNNLTTTATTTPLVVKTNNNDACQLFVSGRGGPSSSSSSFSGGQDCVDTKLNQSPNLFQDARKTQGKDFESELMETKSKLMNALGNCTSLKNEVRHQKNVNVRLCRALRKFGFTTLSMEEEMKKVRNENQHDEDFNTAFIQSPISCGGTTTVTVPELYYDRPDAGVNE